VTLLVPVSAQAAKFEQGIIDFKILKQWQEGLNEKDLDLYISSFTNSYKEQLKLIFEYASDEDKQFIEFFTVDNSKFKNIVQLNLQDIKDIYNLEQYQGVNLKFYISILTFK